MRKCSVDGCEEKHCANGYCRTHNYRFKRHGDPTIVKQVQAKGITEKCSVDGCETKHYAKGYCKKHHYRWERYGDPLHTELKTECSIEGCSEKHYGGGYCRTHHYRWKQHGDPHKTMILYNATCKIEECSDKSRKNGYCEKHYLKSDLGKMVYRLAAARRRTRKLNSPFNDFTTDDWNEVLSCLGESCVYCGDSEVDLQQDHVIPLSKGGSNTKNNIVPACPSCNNNKKARLLEDWYPKQDFYSKEQEEKVLRWMGYDIDKNKIQMQLF